MQVPKTAKLEKAASRDQSRPVLTALNLRVDEDGNGWLEATDSYKAVVIPVGVDEGDTPGMIPAAVLPEARKLAARRESVSHVTVNGAAVLDNGATYERPVGKFPDIPQLRPDGYLDFEIGVNARFLLDIAEAFGGSVVKLRLALDSQSGQPSNLRPILVEPSSAERGMDATRGGWAILMPVRVS